MKSDCSALSHLCAVFRDAHQAVTPLFTTALYEKHKEALLSDDPNFYGATVDTFTIADAAFAVGEVVDW